MNHKLELFQIDKAALENSIRILEQHTNAANDNRIFQTADGACYPGDYSNLSLKRSALKNCQCEKAVFRAASFTGSRFLNVTFRDCCFNNATLDFSLFYGCDFSSTNHIDGLINANFSNSNVISSFFSGMPIHKSSVTNSLFRDTVFSDCSIQYASFENTLFEYCDFSNMELRDLNLEFADFVSPKFHNVVLPFSQIPYTFGLLPVLPSVQETVWISSKGQEKKLSVSQYISLYPHLIRYYISRREFFPLANLYIAQYNYDLAFQAIQEGVKKAGYEKDFRILKHLCKLASQSGWCNRKGLAALYNYIYDVQHFEPMEPYQRHDYYLHLGELRSILIGEQTAPTLYFRIQSNILPENKVNVALLLEKIDEIVNQMPGDSLHTTIELRHESPYEWIIIGVAILELLKLLADSLTALCNTIKSTQDVWINQQTIQLNRQMQRLHEQEIQINEAKLQEIQNTTQKGRRQLADAGIILDSSYYIARDNSDRVKQTDPSSGHLV